MSSTDLLYHKSFMDEVKLTGMSGWEVNVVKDLENSSIHVAFTSRASGVWERRRLQLCRSCSDSRPA